MDKPDALGKLMKWFIEFGQFKIGYQPCKTIKTLVVANFIVKFTITDCEPHNDLLDEANCSLPALNLHVDGVAN